VLRVIFHRKLTLLECVRVRDLIAGGPRALLQQQTGSVSVGAAHPLNRTRFSTVSTSPAASTTA
jgi:hypothetical protein